MKKFISHIDKLYSQSLNGFALAHSDIIQLNTDPYFIARRNPKAGNKVVLISGGGSGHEPLHSGFVGHGMLDAACPGHIFTSPTPDQMFTAAQQLAGEAGVLFIVKNYAGDVMNFEIAAEMLDCPHASVLVQDDVSLPKNHSAGRRGVAGTLIVEKIVGAAAEQGLDLAACTQIAQQVAAQTASMGVALSSCTVPELGEPTFALTEHEMEMGVGIHGERGHATLPLSSADDIVQQLCAAIDSDLCPAAGQTALLHINGLGATPLIEQYLMYELAANYWTQRGVNIVRSLVGNYTTSLDMAGISITLSLLDQNLLDLWDAPVHTPHLRWSHP